MKFRKSSLPFSVPAIKHRMVLSSKVAKSLERHCWSADWSLAALNTLHRAITEEKFEELERIVFEEILKSTEDGLQAEFTRINLLHEECDIKDTDSRRKPENFTEELRHPDSRRLFDLLVGLDNMACQLGDLRFAGRITEMEYRKTLSNSKSSLRNAMLDIRKLVGQVKGEAMITSAR